jgi:hypothetical protein
MATRSQQQTLKQAASGIDNISINLEDKKFLSQVKKIGYGDKVGITLIVRKTILENLKISQEGSGLSFAGHFFQDIPFIKKLISLQSYKDLQFKILDKVLEIQKNQKELDDKKLASSLLTKSIQQHERDIIQADAERKEAEKIMKTSQVKMATQRATEQIKKREEDIVRQEAEFNELKRLELESESQTQIAKEKLKKNQRQHRQTLESARALSQQQADATMAGATMVQKSIFALAEQQSQLADFQAENLQRQTNALTKTMSNLSSAERKHFSELHTEIAKKNNELQQDIANKSLEEQNRLASKSMKNLSEQMVESRDHASQLSQNQIAAMSDQTTAMMSQANQLHTELQSQLNTLAQQSAEQRSEIANAAMNQANELNSQLQSLLNDLAQQSSEQRSNIATSMMNQSNELNNQLQALLNQLAQQANELSAEQTNAMMNQANELNSQLQTLLNNLAQQRAEQAADQTNAMMSQANDLANQARELSQRLSDAEREQSADQTTAMMSQANDLAKQAEKLSQRLSQEERDHLNEQVQKMITTIQTATEYEVSVLEDVKSQIQTEANLNRLQMDRDTKNIVRTNVEQMTLNIKKNEENTKELIGKLNTVNTTMFHGFQSTTINQNTMIGQQDTMIGQQDTMIKQLAKIESLASMPGGGGPFRKPPPGSPLNTKQVRGLVNRFGDTFDYCVDSDLNKLGCQAQSRVWGQPKNDIIEFMGKKIRVFIKWCGADVHFCAISSYNKNGSSNKKEFDPSKEVIFSGGIDPDGNHIIFNTQPKNPTILNDICM